MDPRRHAGNCKLRASKPRDRAWPRARVGVPLVPLPPPPPLPPPLPPGGPRHRCSFAGKGEMASAREPRGGSARKTRESARSEVDWDPLSGLGSGPVPDEGKEFNPFASPQPANVPSLDTEENKGSVAHAGMSALARTSSGSPQEFLTNQHHVRGTERHKTASATSDMHFMKPSVHRKLSPARLGSPPQGSPASPPPAYSATAQSHATPAFASTAPIPSVRQTMRLPKSFSSEGQGGSAAPRNARASSPPASATNNAASTPQNVAVAKTFDAEKTLVNIDRVAYVSMNQNVIHGTLRVTNYRVVFEPVLQSKPDSEQWLFQEDSIFDVPLGCVDRIARGASGQVVGGRGKDALMVSLTCKDFRRLHFKFASTADASKVHDLVRMSAFPVSEGQGLRWLFALEFGQWTLSKGSEPLQGWSLYNPQQEFIRQGLFGPGADTKYWRLSDANRRYQLCGSYPSILAVPSTVSDDDLRAVAAFRSKGRIPALTYYNADNKGSIWRSSQPKVGLANNTCWADEKLWASALERANSVAARIVDCRPYKNALGNKAKGMGYEDEVRYPHTSVTFQNIQNIHTIRASMDKLMNLITSSASSSGGSSSVSSPGHNWLGNVENTGWLNHLRSVLNASVTVARYVACNGFPVLVHCSDGWDRTSQVCALAQLLLDPYYRTLEGFPVLVEKEWLSFGYRFMTRTGHGMEGGSEERSPCFLQFIDCVWQLLNQFAPCFEFNEAYLVCILEHLYSCKYGTFLCDNEAERVREAIPLKTISLWDHLAGRREDFLNILYAPLPNELEEKIPLLPHPAVVARKVVLWDAYYLRYTSVPSLHRHAFRYLGRAKFRRDIQSTESKLKAALQEACKEKERLQAKILALRSSVTELSVGDRVSDVGSPVNAAPSPTTVPKDENGNEDATSDALGESNEEVI